MSYIYEFLLFLNMFNFMADNFMASIYVIIVKLFKWCWCGEKAWT